MHTNPRIVRRLVGATAVVLLAGGVLAACGSDSEDSSDTTTATSDGDSSGQSAVTVSEPWARPGTAGGNDAVYMTLTGGAQDDALVGASVPEDTAASAGIHQTTTEGGSSTTAMGSDDSMSDDMGSDDSGSGMMSMQPVDRIEIPAGEKVMLEPGGYHIMLTDLRTDLAAGDDISVTLTFESGGEQTVTVEVRDS
ncbi:MAG: copper chaperone PCu(A)C [Microthrixaceae bacterium]